MLCFRPSAKLLLGLIYFNLASDFLFSVPAGIYPSGRGKRWKKEESITTINGAPTMYQELSLVL